MLHVKKIRFSVRLNLICFTILILSGLTAYPGDQAPKELKGKVTSVSGERIHITLNQKKWLPKPGTIVNLSEEIDGIPIPLKGKFVIIQVNSNSCIAKGIGKEGHGKASSGMHAKMKTDYPNHPKRRSDYMNKFKDSNSANLLKMAKRGDKMSQQYVADKYLFWGDHDNALIWWERVSKGANIPFLIKNSATGRAKILAIRGEFRRAVQILKEAAAQTKPASNSLNFKTYISLKGKGIKSYVYILKEVGYFYEINLKDSKASEKWFRKAARVMETCAKKGVPKPTHKDYPLYLTLLRDLVSFQTLQLSDDAAAVPWLQILAKSGDKRAQKRLTKMGNSW